MARKTTEVSSEFIDELFQITSHQQVLEDVPFIPDKQWPRIKGHYRSVLKLKSYRPANSVKPRRLPDVFDNNMFVTAWVTSTLLEAVQYGAAPKPSDDQLLLALNAIADHQDKTKPYNTSIMLFWRQVYHDKINLWSNLPDHLVSAIGMMVSAVLPQATVYLKLLGYGDILGNTESIMQAEDSFRRALSIPPDLDDTFANIALGSILYKLRDVFPGASSLWNTQNNNLTSVFDALKKYTYRPFSGDSMTNIIDPRTYFYMRKFLDKAKSEGSDLTLATTWLGIGDKAKSEESDLTSAMTWIHFVEELQSDIKRAATMFLTVNNVDVAVTANIIYGMTSAVLSGLVDPQVLNDPIIAQIYINATSLIVFEVKTNFSDRYDLALTYYLSQIQFYWFVARTVAILETARRKGAFPVPVMETVYYALKDVAENEMTHFTLSKAKYEETDNVYFDDILGDDDVSDEKKPLYPQTRGEDRIFTTAMAANALIYTWTVYDEDTKTTHWKDGVSDAVQETITGCISWLTWHALDGSYEPWNVFFTFPVKDFSQIPFWYPANFFEDMNGTEISDWSAMPDTVASYGIKGYIPKEEYDAMLEKRRSLYPIPSTFQGYNSPTANFVFWSSDAITYASTLLAVSRYRNIVG